MKQAGAWIRRRKESLGTPTPVSFQKSAGVTDWKRIIETIFFEECERM